MPGLLPAPLVFVSVLLKEERFKQQCILPDRQSDVESSTFERAAMSHSYPTLAQMGITSFDNISRYQLRREGRADVLKIYYHRPKGSLLSRSKKFTFARPKSLGPMEFQKTEQWHQLEDTSPVLRQALCELHQLLGVDNPVEDSADNTKVQLLADLEHMERVMQSKLDELRRQIEALK